MENKLVPIEHNGVRVITTELLAQVYETDTNNIKNNFNNHKDNFREGVHYYLLKGDELRAFKREVNNIDLVAPNVNQLYLWTERGANRHCKILDTPKAWEQFDNLEETYFMVKEQRKAAIGGKTAKNGKTPEELAAADKRATAMLLNAKNRAASFLQKLYDRAGTKPEYQAMALSDFYSEDGIHLPRMAFQNMKQTYLRRDCGLLRPGWAAPVAEEPRGVSQEAGNSANHPRRCGAVPGGESMITFPVTAETFIADQEKRAGRKFDDFQRELLGEYAELFNLEFDVGMKGEEPSNVLKDTAEFYARKGKLEELEKPVLKHFYACVQYWCREAWKQGAAKAERNGVRA